MRTAARFVLQRVATLDRAIRAGLYPNAGSLARQLEVCRRTIQRDVEFLRDRLNAPIVFDPRRNGYFYSDPDFHLPFLQLTEGELVALFLAERVLQQYRGTPYARQLARAFAKITAGLTDPITIDLNHLDSLYSFRITAPPDCDPTILRDLTAAARQHRRVLMEYWTASRHEHTRRLFDPYHVAAVNGQSYAIGYCHLRSVVKVFASWRIRSLQVTETAFAVPTDFRIDDYLGDSFAILRGEADELYRVRLRFRGPAATYVRERTWHPSQTVAATAQGDLLVSFTLSHLREVEMWALSWMPDCEVLEPAELRERVAQTLAEAAAQHAGTSAIPTTSTAMPGLGRPPRRPSRRRS